LYFKCQPFYYFHQIAIFLIKTTFFVVVWQFHFAKLVYFVWEFFSALPTVADRDNDKKNSKLFCASAKSFSCLALFCAAQSPNNNGFPLKNIAQNKIGAELFLYAFL